MAGTDIFYNLPADKQYLAGDAPLAASIAAGQSEFTSGYDHYKKYGKSQGRQYNFALDLEAPIVFIPIIGIVALIMFKWKSIKKLFK